jgi:hydroxymethylbilane synthase
MSKKTVVMGTRGSRLALAQTEIVAQKLRMLYPEIRLKIEKITTSGDRKINWAKHKGSQIGMFTKEIENALLHKKIDIAVHSMKDLPVKLPDGLKVTAVLERDDPRDGFISRNNTQFSQLAPGSVIGTSSIRRQAQLRIYRSDLKIKDIRGNVDTRISKLRESSSQFDGIILAVAGVRRLYKSNEVKVEEIPVDIIMPQAGQGALCLEIRGKDNFIKEMVAPLNHKESLSAVTAERRLLEKIGGGCHAPVGIYAQPIDDGRLLKLSAVVCSIDSLSAVREEFIGSIENPIELADTLEVFLKERGAYNLLK